MPKYKVGDVSALFSEPRKKPASESGRKIKALFEEFYNKPNSSGKFENKNYSKGALKVKQNAHSPAAADTNGDSKKESKKKRPMELSEPNQDSSETHPKKRRKMEAVKTSPLKDQKTTLDGESYFPRKKTKKSKPNNQFNKIHSEMEDSAAKFPQAEHDISSSSPHNNKKRNKKGKKKNQFKFAVQDEIESETLQFVKDMSPEKKTDQKGKKKKRSKKQKTDSAEPDVEHRNKQNSESPKKVPVKDARKKSSPSENIFDDSYISLETNEAANGIKADQNAVVSKPDPVETLDDVVSRTLFVGNLPMSVTRKSLEKLFSPFGALESCRLRGAVPQKASLPKKIADIKRKFHSGVHSRIGYVVYKDRQHAVAATTLNGTVIEDHHIIVDHASPVGVKKAYDPKRSVFVGNLPFDVEDEAVWSAFAGCGEIESIRVIRDKDTGVGKGFGYVLFQKLQSKENALESNLTIEGRKVRIKSVEEKKKSNHPSNQVNALRRKAKVLKRKDGSSQKHKSIKKIMKREKLNHQKKKIANIFKNMSAI